MASDENPQATATAVLLGGRGPLGSACEAELHQVLGSGATVVGLDPPAGQLPDAVADEVLGAGSSASPLRWLVALADPATIGRSLLEVVLPRVAAAMADGAGGRIVVVAPPATAPGSLVDEARRGADQAAIVGLARALARAVADGGVTVNVVRPGLLATGDPEADDGRAALARSTPIRRLVTADEVAAAVRHLLGDDAGYVNGIVLPVDGGAAMGTGT